MATAGRSSPACCRGAATTTSRTTSTSTSSSRWGRDGGANLGQARHRKPAEWRASGLAWPRHAPRMRARAPLPRPDAQPLRAPARPGARRCGAQLLPGPPPVAAGPAARGAAGAQAQGRRPQGAGRPNMLPACAARPKRASRTTLPPPLTYLLHTHTRPPCPRRPRSCPPRRPTTPSQSRQAPAPMRPPRPAATQAPARTQASPRAAAACRRWASAA
jgi:hypothetical protein